MSGLSSRINSCYRSSQDYSTHHNAKPGDLVLVQEQYNMLKPLILAVNAYVDNRYGRFSHNDILGQRLGRRIYSLTQSAEKHSAGFVHVLKPTPELWSQAMGHRTQIVYPHDAALISFLLDLRPGSVVVESGTGSGSATVAFARVVAPGKVHSYDFHRERAQAAEHDFRSLGIDNIVCVRGGVDVVKDGFVGLADASADAVFLDLPVPYEMGEEVRRVLCDDGAVCIFSPCIEQVQRSCQMLRSSGFHSIRTVTAPIKTYETREMVMDAPGFGNISIELESSSPSRKRARVGGSVQSGIEKTLRYRNRTAGAERLAVSSLDGEGRHIGRVIRPNVRVHSRPFSSMKGHTSYLTFARKCIDFNDPVRRTDATKIPSKNVNGAPVPVAIGASASQSCKLQ